MKPKIDAAVFLTAASCVFSAKFAFWRAKFASQAILANAS
jgi:hypothetical protein